jgi:hypothetical protein
MLMVAISVVVEDGGETLASGLLVRYICGAIVVSGACGNVVATKSLDIRRRRHEGIRVVSLLG